MNSSAVSGIPTMTPELSRRLKFSLLSVSLLLPAGLGLNYALNVLLARVLSATDYGTFAFSASLASVLALGAALGFSQSMMRLVAAYRVQGESSKLAGLLRKSLAFISLSSLLLLVGLLMLVWFSERQDAGTGIVCAALLLPVLTLDLWRESTMRGLHRTVDAILPRQVLLPMTVIAAILLLDLNGLPMIFGTYLVAFLTLELIALLRLDRSLAPLALPAPQYDTARWLKVSSPMGLSALACQGMRSWDIVIVGAIVGLEPAGLYAAAARTALLASLVLRAINLVAGPMLAEHYHAGHFHRFKKLFRMSLVGASALGVPLYVLVWIYAPEIMGIFGADYAQAALLLRILATGELINLITGPVALALTMSQHERVNMYIVLLAAAMSLGLLLLLVPLYGLAGAAMATAASTIMLNVAQCGYAMYFMARLPGTSENDFVRRVPHGSTP